MNLERPNDNPETQLHHEGCPSEYNFRKLFENSQNWHDNEIQANKIKDMKIDNEGRKYSSW